MNRLPTGLVTFSLLLATLTLVFSPGAAAETAPIGFGMDSNSATAQTAAGVKPDYGSFWVGPWTLTSGWGGPDAQMTSMKNAGVTPAIHFYYWGDDISADCLENGCWSSLHNTWKDQAGWNALATQFVDHLNAKMGGKPVVIFLETEFNKRGVATYEPLDGYLAEKAAFFHDGYPAGKVVMALGNWNSAAWGTWDRTAAESDYIGIQGLRSSAHGTFTEYMGLYDALLQGAKTAQTKFAKPVFIQDIAVSSHPEPEYLEHQEAALQKVFTGLPELKAAGVIGIVYRTWADSTNMDTANHHGEAERHWGLAWTKTGPAKPAGEVWIAGVQAERAGITPPPPPAITVAAAGTLTEAEHYATKTAGGQQSDAAASNGKVWNLWSNGHLQQSYDIAPGEYDVTIRARGTWAMGVAPHMVATLGGAPLVTADPGSTLADHTVRVTHEGGLADLRIAFTNDARTSTEDRNLILDFVSFAHLGAAPVAAFSASTHDLDVSVDASASSDADGDVLSYAWDFGDGEVATGPQASHAYGSEGTYTVSLTVSDGKRSDSAAQVVTVVAPNAPPAAAFTATVDGLTARVDASASSDPDGDALTYAWDFGDGSNATGATATHTYGADGTYTVRLSADDGESVGTASKAVTVAKPNEPPQAAFTVSTSGLTVTVDASRSSDPDGDALTYAWDYGDGATASGVTSTHEYATGGTYTVRLTAHDGEALASTTKNVVVKAPFSASFEPSPNVNTWWVEVRVTASETPTKVEAKVDGKPWVALAKTDWGTWAKSFQAPQGSTMTFRATSASGETVTSAPLTWMGKAMTATFTPKAQTNNWWIETKVSASETVAKVDVRRNGGAWTELPATDWASWAKSLHAPDGTKVEFRATGTTGATVTSGVYIWG